MNKYRRYFRNLKKQNLYFGLADDLPDSDYRLESFYKQHKEQGFDNTELWSLYTTLSRFLLPRLKAFAENIHSIPLDLDEPQWRSILIKMIEGIEFSLSESEDMWNIEKSKKMAENLELLGKYYLDLWS